jgi:haloalkane dehalogenase
MGNYVDVGRGPAAVLVHGTPTWGFEWRHVLARLADRHRLVVPDHLGFGLSDRPAGVGYAPEDHAARFAAFMAAVVPDGPVSLVVHDFGGPIALDWALANPSRLRNLTIVNTWMWPFDDDPLMKSRAKMASGALGRFLYRRLNASRKLIMPSAYADKRRLTSAIHQQYLSVFPDADSRELVLFALARALLGSSDYYASLWGRRAALAAVPMSILWGTKDSAFQVPLLERWTRTFPHAAVTRFDDAGHWPHEEVPDTFCDALAAALTRT